MNNAYLNYIATATPEYDFHQKFTKYALTTLDNESDRSLLQTLVNRSQILHRYSVLQFSDKASLLDENNIYIDGEFPDTKERMLLYKKMFLS